MNKRVFQIVVAALVTIALGIGAYFLLKKEKPKPIVKKSVRKIFKVTDKSLDFPFGNFSACSVQGKGKDLQPGVYCRKDGSSDKELVAVKFYLPESWKGKKLNQESVAVFIAENRPADAEISWSFKAPETGGSKREQFFLALTSIDEASGLGQLQIIIVGEMKKAVYSITYTRMFEGKQDKVRSIMKKWLTKNVESYGPPLGLIDPAQGWLKKVRDKKRSKK